MIMKRGSLFALAVLFLAPIIAAQDWAKDRVEKSPRHREWVSIKHEGRSVETKKAFYARVAESLRRELDVRPQDVLINLVEVKKENWSFGNGIAQYAT